MNKLFIKTVPSFDRQAKKFLSSQAQEDLFDYLEAHPEAGDIVVGAGGVRKLRWATGKDNKGKSNDLNNIRPITISDALANIFEKIILSEAQKTHVEHKLQFGFKKNSSCNHAIFVFKETANYYNSKNKPIFACAIDASKAFDKVNRMLMMQKLIGKINPLIWRALYEYYLSSLAFVYNDNEYSIIFKQRLE